MRAACLILCLAALAVAGCKPAPQDAAVGARGGLQINKTGETPAAPLPKATGGKLPVLDAVPAQAQQAPAAAAPSAPAPPRHIEASIDPRYDTPRPDPRHSPDYSTDMGDDNALTARECRRAERQGDPISDSVACQTLMGRNAVDPRLAADCREAADVGDPFVSSRACRRILGRRW